MSLGRSWSAVLCVACAVWLALGAAQAAPRAFESDIVPILEARCLACHGEVSPQAGLDLRTPASILQGGKSGPAITPGSSEASLLVAKIVSGSMPPIDPKLTAEEVQQIREWIDQGAPSAVQSATLITEKEVLPIFQMRCVPCHGKRRQEGELDLRTLASRLRGGKSGPALVPGKPAESLLLRRILNEEMPPPEMLFDNNVRPPSSDEVETLRRWIAAGALPDPESQASAAVSEPLVSDEDRQFWSFQPPTRPPVPAVRHRELVRNPIDAFLLAKLEEKDLSFAPEASRLTLLRRAYLDLLGMPPSPEDIEAFLADSRPDAYERLIDRLLDSPHYGERWAQIWLDVAGYADSEGIIDEDRIRHNAWRYRDSVIRAFNRDTPYDRFLTEQLAGDELIDHQRLAEVTPDAIDSLAATGFLRLTPDGTYSPANGSLAERMNVIADEIQVLSSSVMGLTIGCARCHDHKYDPIPQRDYYRLSAILQTAYDPYDWVKPTERHLDVALESERRQVAEFNAPIEEKIARLEATLEEKKKPLRDQLLGDRLKALPEAVQQDLRTLAATPVEQRSEVQQYLAKKFKDTLEITDADLAKTFPEYKAAAADLAKSIAELKKTLRPKPQIRALYDMGGEPSPVYLLHRGEAQSIGDRVSPGVPAVLRGAGLQPYTVHPPRPDQQTSGNRLALARWLTQPNHPLTARVIVNRVWMQRFGRGIVASPSNFGRTGVPPSHPELLDWLATEFVRGGWSLKALRRLMMTSTAYRQVSRVDPAREAADPENILLSHAPLRRMDAEMLHDSILKVTGRIDLTPFGPPVEVSPSAGGEVVAEGTNGHWRRAIYVLKRRKMPMTMLEVFDFPRMSPNCTERAHSTVAPQALQMMNSDTIREHAHYLAGRLIDDYPGAPRNQIEQLYLRLLTRPPTPEETDAALTSLHNLTEQWRDHLEGKNDPAPRAPTAQWSALGSLAHTLLNSAEFLYID